MIKAAVIGWPIKQSKSPLIHGHWLDEFGIDGSYEKIALSPDDFAEGIFRLVKQGYAGCNVTVPHKEAAMALADELTPRGKLAGAVNTLVFKGGKILADNTDGLGFLHNLLDGVPEWNAASGPALVLGAGGATRGIIGPLLEVGVPEVIVANRTVARAEALADLFGSQVRACNMDQAQAAVGSVQLLVNATSLGMLGQPALDFDLAGASQDLVVTDIVYNPLRTDLLRRAEAKGCRTVDGLGMLLHQAVPGFEAWFGIRPKVTAALRAKIESAL